MKTTCILAIIVSCLSPMVSFSQSASRAGNESTNQVFESLQIGDTVYKNVRVVKATPIEVTLRHDSGGSVIKRQDLPEELKAKYPYNAEKAAEFEKQRQQENTEQLQKAQARQLDANARGRAFLLQRQRILEADLQGLEAQLADLDREIDLQRQRLPKSKKKNSPQHQRLYRLQDQKTGIMKAIKGKQAGLEETRNALSK